MIKFSFILILMSTLNFSPNPKTSGVKVIKAFTQNVMGKNIGYYVEFKNNTGKTIDAIEWYASFYNNFNDLKGGRRGEWSAGNYIKPVKNGGEINDIEGVWVNGASKIQIEITRVHFTNGTTWNRK